VPSALSFVCADPQRFYGKRSSGPSDHIFRLIRASRAGDKDARATLQDYGRRGASSFTLLTGLGTRSPITMGLFLQTLCICLTPMKARTVTRAGALVTVAKYRALGIPNPGLAKGAPVLSSCQSLLVYMHVVLDIL
jgi:hypothetical protein